MTFKVLHSALMTRPFVGIVNQMSWEQDAARELGLAWDVHIASPVPAKFAGRVTRLHSLCSPLIPNFLLVPANWLWIRAQYALWIMRVQSDYNCVLLRHSSYDPFQALLAVLLRKKLSTVHHTLETIELASEGTLRASIQAAAERVLGGISLRFARVIVAVTDEIGHYETGRALGRARDGHVVYPNGILYGADDAAPQTNSGQPKVLEFVFVASSFYRWQGLDLLLESVKRSTESFIIHVVGQVDEALRREYSDSRVLFHGMLQSPDIARLLRRSTVGLATLALSRNGMTQACPLKVREYLRSGLPVYGGYQDLFPEDFPFFASGQAEVSQILSFANRLREVDRHTVSVVARPYIDKCYLLRSLHATLSKHYDLAFAEEPPLSSGRVQT